MDGIPISSSTSSVDVIRAEVDRQCKYLSDLLKKSLSAMDPTVVDNNVLIEIVTILADNDIVPERARRKKLSEDVEKVSKILRLNPEEYEKYSVLSDHTSKKTVLRMLVDDFDSYQSHNRRVFKCITSHHRYHLICHVSSSIRTISSESKFTLSNPLAL